MADRIEEIKARLGAATTSSWYDNDLVAQTGRTEDAEFIAHAPEDIAYLLERLEESEALIDLAETAWWLIANASGGNWGKQSDEWQGAAIVWREKYHAALAKREGKE